MGPSLKSYKEKNNCRDKNCDRRTLKAAVTKDDTKLEEADYSKTVFSNLTFMVAAAPN